jgi:mono/diheme cytochrome c family protein
MRVPAFNKASCPRLVMDRFAIAPKEFRSPLVHTWVPVRISTLVRIWACLKACRNPRFISAPSGAGAQNSTALAASQAVFCSLLLLLSLAVPLNAQQPRQDKSARKTTDAQLVRGKYLVEDVATCGMCHTPRDSSGNLDRSRWLEGAPLWIQPSVPASDWPLQAPRLAGSPPGTDAELITLLTTGIWRTGKPLRPPMPQFRMTREDAAAVVAYLRSLSPVPRN